MGAPAQALAHSLTDRIAAIMRLDLAGFNNELVSASNLGFWPQVDGSTDAAVVAALAPFADALDRQSLPEKYAAALAVVKNRPDLVAFPKAFNSLVTSADGGSYPNLQAYLAAVSATLHPLAAEVFRAALGEAIFSVAGNVTNVFAPNYQSKAPDRVYAGADGSLTEETAAAGSATTADMTLFASNGNSLYIGHRCPFNALALALSTLGSASIAPTISYWNGTSWAAVTGLVDSGNGFQRNDLLTFTLPTTGQWVRNYKDAGGTNFADKTPLYYLKITRTAGTLVTPPVGTCARIVPVPTLLNTSGNHLGVDQPPLALIRITASNTIVVTPLNTVDFSRFAEPGLSLRALTALAGTFTLTLAYVDQDGANQSQVQSGFASPAALDVAALTLVGSGARSVLAGCTATTGGATAGVLEVYAAELRTPAL